ncbi:hypothetical protein [Tropicibacter naphthalenivorans]|uniref:DUF1127 domain-containing protein n=1 Tax=Tropicibacter naphthalenivorans TaxID=441103 RepID=A0A0N7LYZ5_9RHOB|nr:hypothetical protein [Tropicibacter naphthalenivorans]CUH76241.1 hypothetical protein TRN7648_00850 [Tropicibacter naphthalenivorans]SMC39211.1 hypothetical protein SAMN04488093_10134 [Tropicibacter naphthalenivorans]
MRDNVQLRVGHTRLNTKIDRYFASIGLGFNPSALRRARLREIIVLEAQTDEDLAQMGLTRDQILPHVFRDLIAA